MTREEKQKAIDAVERLNALKQFIGYDKDSEIVQAIQESLDMAIKALEQRWIPVSERLPEDFGTYLITLENGDVCQCDFNPDFWDEDNNREGAFTYYHQYFDQATLGMIDEEEETVDAIAWMPFEPYKAESEDYE